MNVSVIIPVFNDSERLKECLSALERQTYPKKEYEVIVVGNGSEEDVKSAVSNCPREKLLGFLKGRPDFEQLKTKDTKDLLITCCESWGYSAVQGNRTSDSRSASDAF